VSKFNFISHKAIIEELEKSGEQYALRTVERLENSTEGEVVRLGVMSGVRIKV
jgi:hypothetical protein